MPSQPTKILQIVPRLSPDVDGVGDYTLSLAHELRDRYQIHSDFLVVRPSERTQPTVDGFTVHRLMTHSVAGLLDRVPANISTVVLQYSNYPYLLGKVDAPAWLVAALMRLKQRGIRILIMFHEFPTLQYQRVRLPNPIQRRVSRGLAQVADIVVTNNAAFQHTLATWTNTPVHCIPNFSTIGEVQQVLPLHDRDRALIIFGSTDRGRIYRSNLEGVQRICQQLNIHTLYDIGHPIDWDSSSLDADITVIKTGLLPATAVSKLMFTAFAGIFDYRRFPNNLAKSTVYAAYCAHGLLPLCNLRSLPPQDGILADRHYLDTHTLHQHTDRTTESLSSFQRIADNAHAWYNTHTLAKCAAQYASFFSLPQPQLSPSARDYD
ncbi:MAG: hypothetical protein AAFN08_06070 [Cyanobacteria bacterium J06559_3]